MPIEESLASEGSANAPSEKSMVVRKLSAPTANCDAITEKRLELSDAIMVPARTMSAPDEKTTDVDGKESGPINDTMESVGKQTVPPGSHQPGKKSISSIASSDLDVTVTETDPSNRSGSKQGLGFLSIEQVEAGRRI